MHVWGEGGGVKEQKGRKGAERSVSRKKGSAGVKKETEEEKRGALEVQQ